MLYFVLFWLISNIYSQIEKSADVNSTKRLTDALISGSVAFYEWCVRSLRYPKVSTLKRTREEQVYMVACLETAAASKSFIVCVCVCVFVCVCVCVCLVMCVWVYVRLCGFLRVMCAKLAQSKTLHCVFVHGMHFFRDWIVS